MTDRGGPHERHPLTFFAALAWAFATQAVLFVAVALTESFREGAREDLVNLGACELLTYSVVLLVMLRIYEREAPLGEVLGLRKAPVVGSLLAAIGGAGLYPALSTLDDLLAKRWPTTEEEHEALSRIFATDTNAQRAAVVVTLAIVLPLCEELFFRGVLYGGLRRGRVSLHALIESAVLYAVSRADARAMPLLLVLGLVFGWLRARSGSVVPALLAHVAFFAVPCVPIALGRAEIELWPRLWIAESLGAGLICLAIAGLVFTRSERSLGARLDDG